MASYHFVLSVLLMFTLDIGATTFQHSEITSVPSTDEVQAFHSRHAHTLRLSDCPAACTYRCSKASKHKPCIFYCNLCCSKCLCVPPGTFGHKELCPCYNNMKNSRGGPKCP
eukprot:c18014_g1_i2 orf=246-581(-)